MAIPCSDITHKACTTITLKANSSNARCQKGKPDPEVCSINVEVADRYLVPVTAYGEVILKLVDKHGKDCTVRSLYVFYVPGLTQGLFSIPKLNKFGNTATVKNGVMHLSFKGKLLTTPLSETPK